MKLRGIGQALDAQDRLRPTPPARCYDDETVRRFRPFARRRFNTRRPFFVAILTRKPWVRRRRRLFGWKVRFMMSGPLSRTKTQRRNTNSSEPPSDVSIAGACRKWVPAHRIFGLLPLLSGRKRYVTVASPAGVGRRPRPPPGGPSCSFVGRGSAHFQLRPSAFCGNPPKFSTTVEKNVEKPQVFARVTCPGAGPRPIESWRRRGNGVFTRVHGSNERKQPVTQGLPGGESPRNEFGTGEQPS